MPTWRHRYVDPDATDTPENGTTWGKAYASLNAAEQAEDNTGDIVSTDEIVVFHCRASSGTADTTAATISTWTTGASNYIVVAADTANDSYPYDGVNEGSAETTGTGHAGATWSESKYRLSVGNANALLIQEDFIRLDGLQVEKSSSSANGQACINMSSVGSGATIYISNCIGKQPNTGPNSYAEPVISLSNTSITAYVWNCILYGASTLNNAGNAVLYLNVSAASVFGCTVIGGYYGIRRVAGTVTAKNVYAGNSAGGDYAGTGASFVMVNCASSDTTAEDTDPHDSVPYDTTTFVSVTPGNSEYLKPKAGGGLDGQGTTLTDDPPGSTALSTDLTGYTRA